MRHLKIGIPISGALAVLLGLGLNSCVDENPWGNSSNEKGSISLSLTTNSDIATAKPVFRSGEDESDNDPNNLSSYITVPTADQFSISLEKSDGSYKKTWSTLSDFKNEAANSKFNTGSYTLTAFYGEKGKQDFEAPYFEASSSFTVFSDQTHEVNLEAELLNSMVKINYTEDFKNYMSNFYTIIHTEGKANDITFNSVESRPAFIEPNNANITVYFTTKDKNHSSSYSLGDFQPEARTLHNITFDIKENQNGNATLDIRFDDTLETENVSVDLSDVLKTTPAPVITCEGFANGETIDMLEGTGSDVTLKMNVNASAQIKSARLTVDSPKFIPAWGSEIDLCAATPEQIQQIQKAGIEAYGFGFTGQPTDLSAFLTLTDFGKSLPKGVHTISLVVTDINNKVSETANVILNSEEITIAMVGDPTIVYGSGQAVLTLDYNGTNPSKDISFTAINAKGWHDAADIISCEEITATRAFENKRYVYTIKLPTTTKSNIEIKVFHKGTNNVGTFEVPVSVPAYKFEAYDAFSKYAYIQVTTPDSSDPSVLAAVINNLSIKANNKDITIAASDVSTGIITLSGLTPATPYAITSSITGDAWNNNGSFTTETALTIPNGDFSGIIVNGISFDNIQVGGKYKVSPVDYTLKANIKRDIPADWATVNSLTAWEGSSNKNTWFVVPSTYVENQVAILKSVGYNHNGTTPATSGGAASTKYYCQNAPADQQLEKASGELFLGEYTFNGNESRSEGKAFASRPAAVTFDYIYNPINNDDKGYVKIEVLDADDHTIGEIKELALEASSEMKTVTVNLSYGKFGKKAAKLKVNFKSSNQAVPPINIPSGSSLNEHQTLGSKNIGTNNYHAVAIGSELRIDNVTAVYEDPSSPANAPKRKSIKRK